MTADRLFVQRISIHWTKASRGGAGASARNAVPQALVLPKTAIVWHSVRFDEAKEFTAIVEAMAVELPQDVEAELGLRVEANSVSMLPRTPFGAPTRYRRPPRARLESGASLRWILNSRDGRDSGWYYTQVVYNVALTDASDLTAFTRDPSVVVDERATLR